MYGKDIHEVRTGLIIFVIVAVMAAFMLSGSGCSTTPEDPAETNTVDDTYTSLIPGVINIGLLNVDPSVYGQEIPCPGADVDAGIMYRLAVQASGADPVILLDAAATRTNIIATVTRIARTMTSNDCLVITVSGHGGQRKDTSGDETDGMDETIVLFDGEWVDDDVLKLIREFNIRILLITDTCHSEGNFRFFNPVIRAVTLGKYGNRKPADISGREDRWPGQLIQFAGCREESYSYGTDAGGTWTLALKATFKPGISYRQWFDAAAARMPKNQKPVWVEYGAVQDAFRNGRAMK